ncbi:hypothetical protein SKAU_G00288280 [Synaphobranchus kaupii]|uniref:Uncharacterized protein n=1 Tax=Synaphobranchus kaupii TaxID=118154 RepID=A0A9Q1IJX1_SYNKA|nr:hypothetical protein SKAU_G00288280 [Synaphobranchus kaupii]
MGITACLFTDCNAGDQDVEDRQPSPELCHSNCVRKPRLCQLTCTWTGGRTASAGSERHALVHHGTKRALSSGRHANGRLPGCGRCVGETAEGCSGGVLTAE